MRFLLFAITFTATSSLSMLSYAKDMPAGVVCAQMEEAGERLMSGQSNDFYFINVGETEFPVPSFFTVVPPDRIGNSEVIIETRPEIAASKPAIIRKAANPCSWTLKAHIGPLESLYEKAGGEEEFKKKIESTYNVGSMEVSVLKANALGLRLIAAEDGDGFIMFFTDTPERAYWLIRLAAKLGENGT